MQAAHPLAVSGLLAHSTAMDEPYDRLARTAEVMSTIGFGAADDAERITAHVRAMHAKVRGRLREPMGRFPAGTPYRADQPDLLLWVLFTLVDSGVVVYRKYVGSMSRAEEAAYWDDYKVVGDLFGLSRSDMPDTLDDLRRLPARDARGRHPAGHRLGAQAGAGDRAGAAGAVDGPAAAADGQLHHHRAAARLDPAPVRLRRRCRRRRCARRWWPAARST